MNGFVVPVNVVVVDRSHCLVEDRSTVEGRECLEDGRRNVEEGIVGCTADPVPY